MTIGSYPKAQIRKLMVNGVDVTQAVRSVYVGSSIMTPYNMGKISLLDASQIQDGLYESGVPVSIVYSAGDGTMVREYEFLSMANRAGTKLGGNRSGAAELTAVSQSFFNLQNEHTSQHQNVPASDALQKLHAELDPSGSLNATKTKGLIGDQEPFHLNAVKLGKGINTIRGRMTDEQYQSGAFLYFRDQNGEYTAAPIEKLFAEADGVSFAQSTASRSFIRDQSTMAYNIFSMQKGGMGQKAGTDNAAAYQSMQKQRGGQTETGFNWQTLEYKPAVATDVAARQTPGQSTWQGPQSEAAGKTNHKFMWDPNQKKTEDFEGDIANKNAMAALASQGSMTVNVPLEGGMNCTVGKGCNLSLPSEVGTGSPTSSTAGGRSLVVAMGEYLFLGDGGVQGVASMQTASGGKQS